MSAGHITGHPVNSLPGVAFSETVDPRLARSVAERVHQAALATAKVIRECSDEEGLQAVLSALGLKVSA